MNAAIISSVLLVSACTSGAVEGGTRAGTSVSGSQDVAPTSANDAPRTESESEPTPAQSGTDRSVPKFLAGFGGGIREWDVPDDPGALAEAVDLVISGRLQRVSVGRTDVRGSELPPYTSLLLEVDGVEVLSGELPQPDAETVFVELRTGGSGEPAVFDATLPRGVEAVLYLVRGSYEGDPKSDEAASVGPAWPGGNDVFRRYGPFGLVIEDPRGQIFVAPSPDVVDGATLADYHPTSPDFPDPLR